MNLENLNTHRIDLAKPLLLIMAERGVLACSYLNIETFNKTSEACAIVTGVANYEEMLVAPVTAVSKVATEMGVAVGDTGAEALKKMGTV